jgi:hypothetical protein
LTDCKTLLLATCCIALLQVVVTHDGSDQFYDYHQHQQFA